MHSAHQQQEAIVSGVNETRFVGHLRELFTSSTVVLGEIAQNARRAGASQVVFEFADEGRTLVVTDDGCGVEDFRKLVVVAESGWSEALMAEENPFGIGFAAVSFAAETVLVESRGKSVRFTTEDLVAKRPIPVVTASFIGGTRITLSGFRVPMDAAKGALAKIARGFPIPVVVDGKTLPRPHARQSLEGAETPVGFVFAPGVHNADLAAFAFHGHVYCQGLPVQVDGFTSRFHVDADAPVVHINNTFQARVPDRDKLVDGDRAREAITEALRELMRGHLVTAKAQLPAATFAARYWSGADMVCASDIMNDVPVLPVSVLYAITADLRQPADWDQCWGHPDRPVTKQQVEAGEVVLFDEDLCGEFEGDNFARMAFVAQQGWLLVGPTLHEGHWATPHIRAIAAMQCRIAGMVRASAYYSGSWTYGDVRLVEGLAVSLDDVSAPIPSAIAVEGVGDLSGILVPVDEESPAHVLLQMCTYVDENEEYCDSDHDRDVDEFLNVLATLRGEDAAETLQKCLAAGSAGHRDNLKGLSFQVAFDVDGGFVVTRA